MDDKKSALEAPRPLSGIHHVAVPAADLQRAIRFYCENLGFRVFDATSKDWAMVALGNTSLSFFQLPPDWIGPTAKSDAPYRHFGITVPSREAVDEWHAYLAEKATIHPCKLHRDGSYGFYLQDSESNFLEIIWIPQNSSRQIAQTELR